jgi:hypothetical protein
MEAQMDSFGKKQLKPKKNLMQGAFKLKGYIYVSI